MFSQWWQQQTQREKPQTKKTKQAGKNKTKPHTHTNTKPPVSRFNMLLFGTHEILFWLKLCSLFFPTQHDVRGSPFFLSN
jgi:hypothetical protein